MTEHHVYDLVRQLNPSPAIENLLSAETGSLMARAIVDTALPRTPCR